MWDLCESHAAYSKGIVLGISRGLGSCLLYSPSTVDNSSEGDDHSTCQLLVIRASSIVQIDITSKYASSFECSFKMQFLVFRGVEVLRHTFESYHMLIARVVIVPAEHSNDICTIGLYGSDYTHKASDHRLVYGQIAGFFFWVPLGKLDFHWRGNWFGLIHSESHQDHANVAVLMGVDRVMPQIVMDVHAEIEDDAPEIMPVEPHLHLTLDLRNQALVRNHKEIIDIQNNFSNDYTMMILDMEHKQSTIDTWCQKHNRDHEFMKVPYQMCWDYFRPYRDILNRSTIFREVIDLRLLYRLPVWTKQKCPWGGCILISTSNSTPRKAVHTSIWWISRSYLQMIASASVMRPKPAVGEYVAW